MGVINRLFAKLYARYGNQWANQWDDDRVLKMAKNEWYEQLKHLDILDIKRGLDNYKGEYPPNIVQFYDSCTAKPIGRPAPCYKLWQSVPDRRKLEHKTDKSVGNEFLDSIREILK